MRTTCAAAVAFGALSVFGAAASLVAAAQPPPAALRGCGTRGESDRPQRLPAKGGVRIGPVTIWPSVRTTGRTSDPTWRFATKSPVVLPARAEVVLAVAPQAVSVAGFQDHGGYVSAVRFEACREREPARAYRGTVGRFTGFPLAIGLTRKSACVPIEVWIDGKETPIRRTLPVGRRAC